LAKKSGSSKRASSASRSYNAVLRGLKAQYGLNHKQARVAYTGLKTRLGEAPKAVDLKRHPRMAKEEAIRAPARERAQRAAQTRAANRARAAPITPVKAVSRPAKAPAGAERPRSTPPTGGGVPTAPVRKVIPPDRYDQIQDEWDNWDREDWEQWHEWYEAT